MPFDGQEFTPTASHALQVINRMEQLLSPHSVTVPGGLSQLRVMVPGWTTGKMESKGSYCLVGAMRRALKDCLPVRRDRLRARKIIRQVLVNAISQRRIAWWRFKRFTPKELLIISFNDQAHYSEVMDVVSKARRQLRVEPTVPPFIVDTQKLRGNPCETAPSIPSDGRVRTLEPV